MSSHALDNQMNERLIKELEDLKKQVRDLRTVQAQGSDAVNLQLSPTQVYELTLDHNQGGFITFTFENEENRRLFTMFEYSAFQKPSGSWLPSETHMIGTHLNNYADYWDIWHHTNFWLSDSNNVKERFLVRNRTGSTQTVVIAGCWRYVVSSGTGSAE